MPIEWNSGGLILATIGCCSSRPAPSGLVRALCLSHDELIDLRFKGVLVEMHDIFIVSDGFKIDQWASLFTCYRYLPHYVYLFVCTSRPSCYEAGSAGNQSLFMPGGALGMSPVGVAVG